MLQQRVEAGVIFVPGSERREESEEVPRTAPTQSGVCSWRIEISSSPRHVAVMAAALFATVASASAVENGWTGLLGLTFESDVPVERRAMMCPSGCSCCAPGESITRPRAHACARPRGGERKVNGVALRARMQNSTTDQCLCTWLNVC